MWTILKTVQYTLKILPGLVIDPRQRALWQEMRAFQRRLPSILDRPLPEALDSLTPINGRPDLAHRRDQVQRIRRLADLTAATGWGSPLGYCLRRSLLRYHFLRRAGVPVVIHLGARSSAAGSERRIIGHAWLTLHGQPYFEYGSDWSDHTQMLIWPPQSSPSDPNLNN